ncbi:MAG: chorismate mutase [Glaciimonas sp.]|nr:chorismate mutase [Glaciimonas sp.]
MKKYKHYRKIPRTTALLFTFWLVGCSAGNAAPDEVFLPLVQSMADRLATADQVALSKWDSKGAVYAPQREGEVIAKVKALAPNYALSSDDAADIFTDQMEANKQVQYALLNNWRRQGDAPTTPRQSLVDDIRPILDKMQFSILQNLQDVAALRNVETCPFQVARIAGKVAYQARLDAPHLAALDRAVARICVSSQ